MGCCSLAWRALMRRNLIYRKRHWLSTILEFVLPALFVLILLLIKSAFESSGSFESEIVNATVINDNDAFSPMSFSDYVRLLQAKRVCVGNEYADIDISDLPPGIPQEILDLISFEEYVITGVPQNGNDWQVPLIKCDSRKCNYNGENATSYCEYSIIAISGSSESDIGGKQRAIEFKSWVEEKYPIILNRNVMPFPFPELIQEFNSPDDMDEYVKSKDYGKYEVPKIIMGIVFDGNDVNNYKYQLRQNSTNFNAPEEEGRPATTTTPTTRKRTDSYARQDDACTPEGGTPYIGSKQNSCTGQYIYNGVLTFQRLVHDFILEQKNVVDEYRVAEGGVRYAPFPTRSYQTSGFYSAIEGFGPILVTLGLLYPVASMISYITKEKDLRQKELMKMMSVTESDIGCSWFFTFLSLHFITSIFATFFSSRLFENSASGNLFFFWLFTMINVIVFCMTMAAITSKPTRAVLIGLLIFFSGVFLTLAVDYESGAKAGIQALSLHPIAAFTYGLRQIAQLEDNGVGLTPDSVSFSENQSGYSFADTMQMLFIDSFFWGFLCWYLNRVIPQDYGQALPIWFPFTTQYWCPSRSVADTSDISVEERLKNTDIPYEPVSDALKRQASEGKSIEIHDLKKSFGEKDAVKGLSLSMYSNQITALLGHNGAGKTTTINMLTGAMGASDGYAVVAGKDIRTNIQAIRQDIGICLQHDCLFPNLTVREHLQFFSRLKGLYRKISKRDAEAKIDQAIRDVALFEKRNSLARSLSGGMKRKLSVAIAFSGGSKVVLLDEPTSGMDPFSRRFTWNVIRQYRQDRCIILTTHFMDEADILGDRIAIMADGVLRCAGSSLFLKKTYGVGYQLTLEKSRNQKKIMPDSGSDSDGDYIENDDDQDPKIIVKRAVPESTLLNDVGTEIRIQLPLGAASKFAGMFSDLDRSVKKGNLTSYGVSMTTLDEVFLLVARGETTEAKRSHLKSSRAFNTDDIAFRDEGDDDKSTRSRMDLEKEGLFPRHLGALFRKRAAIFKRDKKAWLCTTFLPSVFVLLGLVAFKYSSPQRNLDPLTLNISDLNKDVTKEPVQPIHINSPGTPYICQPGSCSYRLPVFQSNVTDEIYAFCGSSYTGELDGFSQGAADKCSIENAYNIMSTLNEDDGIEIIETPASDVVDSSEALLATSDAYSASQYGAVWFTREYDSIITSTNSSFSDQIVTACNSISPFLDYSDSEDCSRFRGIGYLINYNFTGLHIAPTYQALADEAIVRFATNNRDFSITATIAPLPITATEESFGNAEDVFLAWLLVVLSFPLIGGAFATFVVAERHSKAKHLQTVAGVQPSAYWASTFLWDCLNYQLPLWVTVALIFIFSVDSLTTSDHDLFSGVLAILFFFGPAAAGFSYCVSFAFSSASLCNVVIIISGFIIGLGGSMTCFILTLLSADPLDPRDNLRNAATILTWILRFTPSFCLGKGLLYAIYVETFIFIEAEPDLSVWSEAVLLWEVIFLIGQSIVYTSLAVWLDRWSTNPKVMGCWRGFIDVVTLRFLLQGNKGPDITTALPEDSDVLAEQNRVLEGEANDDLIVINQLSKVFNNGKIAVNNMSLGIPPGECFGLLGINGAGKTTTMGMLTAEFPPSSGDATLAGFSVTREPQRTRRRIGYCPQFDAHFVNMTGREHIELYAAIKGIPRKFVREAVEKKLAEVGLSDYDSNRLCINYSGGMRRRLSLACATIGQPQIVFLDECSTGVDPVARREIWQMVSDMVSANVPIEEKTSVILTTHSMEECEALCPRIGIMANGRLRCLGSAQHLKNKFGQGYQVELKAATAKEDDPDYISNARILVASKLGISDPESVNVPSEDVFFLHGEAIAALQKITGDDFLSKMVSEGNPYGYSIWKDAVTPVGVPLDDLAVFATDELRIRAIGDFISNNFTDSVLRERQDMKVRYEVSSEGTYISSIFARIEDNKGNLCLADYGVSQTSLEQVFNAHAAEAEKLKHGRDDH